MSEVKPLPLSIKDLSFQYNSRSTPAIKHISFDVNPGEVLLIAGSSGCGKTTLMRCINGLIPNAYHGEIKGEIELFGKSVFDIEMSEISQEVGTVLQDPERQILGTYVLNDVAFGLESLGMPTEKIFPRVDQALEKMGILYLRDRETFGTSGGEKQKIALAGVLAMKPRILLLDEPLASLDPASAMEALKIFRQLADEGLSVMIVEHRVEDVLAIKPERVIYMDEGEITYDGDRQGMMEVVDYTRIKLPAEVVLRRAKNEPPPEFEPVLKPQEGDLELLVEFEGVNFQYDEDYPFVLHDINFKINKGDIIAILGHNGSGKTTMVKHALGLLKPSQGHVYLEGNDTRDITVATAAKSVGYVFQSPTQMLFAPTVGDELAFGPKNLGFSKAEIQKSVKWAIETVHLEEELDTPPLALSFGQQKRISIASVLSMRSRLLMMDEPTAGQDYWNYRAFMDAILQMPGFDSIVFITHDLDLALIYANRIMILFDGQIVADGSPPEVLKDEDQLINYRILPTSLLKINQQFLPKTGSFYRAETLAHRIG
ncbi:MAG: ABC transporter ATP-binding protein [Brevefilum sp.]|nr:ABC transporter ATP-binding protein [Brevefilum sp.]MDW7754238.1 ABC transporter ATP-binding protein [Brevefilum sp.]